MRVFTCISVQNQAGLLNRMNYSISGFNYCLSDVVLHPTVTYPPVRKSRCALVLQSKHCFNLKNEGTTGGGCVNLKLCFLCKTKAQRDFLTS